MRDAPTAFPLDWYSAESVESKWRLTAYTDPLTANLAFINSELGPILQHVGASLVRTGRSLVGAVASGVADAAFAIRDTAQSGAQLVVDAYEAYGRAVGYVEYATEVLGRAELATIQQMTEEARATGRAVKILFVRTFDTFSSAFDVSVDRAGHAAWSPVGALDVSLNSDATIFWRQPVPEAANVMRFSFDFLVADPGTMLEVFVDGVSVAIINGADYFGRGRQLSDAIDASEIAGRTVTIAFRLSNAVEGRRGTVRIDDFLFARVTAADAPFAVAVAPAVARQGSLVRLDGSASTDTTGSAIALTYQWTQVQGPAAALTGHSTALASFVAGSPGTYQIGLEVNDGYRTTRPAVVSIQVPRLGDVDLDGDVDRNDVAIITTARNQTTGDPNDIRDLDGNGVINALDARIAATRCTRPSCAVN